MGTLADKMNYLNETKTVIREAINTKGGALTEDNTFRSYADAISNISTGIELAPLDNEALAEEVLLGKALYDDEGNLVEGTLEIPIGGEEYIDFSKSILSTTEFKALHPDYILSIPEGITRITQVPSQIVGIIKGLNLPDSLLYIDGSAFQNASSSAFTSLTVPVNVIKISANAFYHDYYLKTIRFLGTPTTVDGLAFQECNKVENIYVPWASGAVSGAPWGATNATVHYNYTGE